MYACIALDSRPVLLASLHISVKPRALLMRMGLGHRGRGREGAGRWSANAGRGAHRRKQKYLGPRIPNQLFQQLVPSGTNVKHTVVKNVPQKRRREEPSVHGHRGKKTRFYELLDQAPWGDNHAAANAAEDALQAKLAKRLGLDKRDRRKRQAKSADDVQVVHGQKEHVSLGVGKHAASNAQQRRAAQQGYSTGSDLDSSLGELEDSDLDLLDSDSEATGLIDADSDYSGLPAGVNAPLPRGAASSRASRLPDNDSDDHYARHAGQLESDDELADSVGQTFDEDEVESSGGQPYSSVGRSISGDDEGGVLSDDGDEDKEEEEDGAGDGSKGLLQARRASGAAASSSVAYIPPALRKGEGSGASSVVARKIRGLLNRLADVNMASIVTDLVHMFESGNRLEVMQEVTEQLLQAVVEGPKATDKFAAVTACCVAALAGKTGSQRVVAHFLQALATVLEEARQKGSCIQLLVHTQPGRTLAASNLVNVFAHLYGVGLIGPEVLYGLLQQLRSGFSEADVALIAAVMQACGLQLRSDDATAMKHCRVAACMQEFVLSVHSRAAEVSKQGNLTPRAEAMLGLVMDVKNNRAGPRKGGGQLAGVGRTAAALGPGVMKWVGSCGVAEVQLRNLTWQLLLQPNKKGHWWLGQTRNAVSGGGKGIGSAAELALSLVGNDRSNGDKGNTSAEQLVALAAQQRFNTDARRAVFFAVMGSSDAVDAAEKLLSLPLKGEQQREVVRVTVECCLQEQTWNPYYAHLLLRLMQTSKAHRVTLQYCLWDHMKALHLDGQTDDAADVNAQLRRNMNLARLTAMLLTKSTMGLQVLKVVDFSASMSAMELLTWRALLRHSLGQMDGQTITDAVARLLAVAGLQDFCRLLATFLTAQVVPWLQHQPALRTTGAASHTTRDEVTSVQLASKLLRKGAALSV